MKFGGNSATVWDPQDKRGWEGKGVGSSWFAIM